MGFIDVEGYPDAPHDIKEANINDLVVFALYPILLAFQKNSLRHLRLQREKEIRSVDSTVHGLEEFTVMDCISKNNQKFILVVETKRISVRDARKQCFLAMRDMYDNNGSKGTIYGFLT